MVLLVIQFIQRKKIPPTKKAELLFSTYLSLVRVLILIVSNSNQSQRIIIGEPDTLETRNPEIPTSVLVLL